MSTLSKLAHALFAHSALSAAAAVAPEIAHTSTEAAAHPAGDVHAEVNAAHSEIRDAIERAYDGLSDAGKAFMDAQLRNRLGPVGVLLQPAADSLYHTLTDELHKRLQALEDKAGL